MAAKKKSIVVKKKAIKKKSVTPVSKLAVRTIIKKVPKKPVDIPQKETVEIDLPVKETSPEIKNDIPALVESIDTKSIQKEAARHYDNHHIRLSGKKGGLKPSGKKPLW